MADKDIVISQDDQGQFTEVVFSPQPHQILGFGGDRKVTMFPRTAEIPVTAMADSASVTTASNIYSFRLPFAMTIETIRASLTAASTVGEVEIDIKLNGTTIFSTNLTIDQDELTSKDADVAYVLSKNIIDDDDLITIDVVSGGTGATGLKLWILGYRILIDHTAMTVSISSVSTLSINVYSASFEISPMTTSSPMEVQMTNAAADLVATMTTGGDLSVNFNNNEIQNWVSRVTAAGGTISNGTLTAANKWLTSIKNAGIRHKILRANLFCGSNVAACMIPIINDQGYSSDSYAGNQFSSSDYNETTGLKATGGSKRISTGVIPSTCGMTTTSNHMMVWVKEQVVEQSTEICAGIGGNSASQLCLMIKYNSTWNGQHGLPNGSLTCLSDLGYGPSWGNAGQRYATDSSGLGFYLGGINSKVLGTGFHTANAALGTLGTITASGYDSASVAPWKALQGTYNGSVYWHTSQLFPQWLQFQFLYKKKITRYGLVPPGVNSLCFPQNWTLQASNDGQNWTVIDTVSGVTTCDAINMYNVDDPGSYYYYRLVVTANIGNSSACLTLCEFALYDGTPAAMTNADSGLTSLSVLANKSYILDQADDLSGTLPYVDLYVFAQNSSNNAASFSTKRLSGYSAGTGLSKQEAIEYYTATKQFMVDMTRATATAVATPSMTSNTAPSGEAYASSAGTQIGGGWVFNAWRAFSGIVGFGTNADGGPALWRSLGYSGADSRPEWLKYRFATAKTIMRYVICETGGGTLLRAVPADWTFEGSNDNSAWTVLDRQVRVLDWVNNGEAANDIKSFVFYNTTSYTYYRINVTKTYGDYQGTPNWVEIQQFQMYEDVA